MSLMHRLARAAASLGRRTDRAGFRSCWCGATHRCSLENVEAVPDSTLFPRGATSAYVGANGCSPFAPHSFPDTFPDNL